MTKKKIKLRNKNKSLRNKSKLNKIAVFTTKSLSKVITNFKKKQEIKKLKEIKLRKLSENNQIIKVKKELKIWEEKLKKEETRISIVEIYNG